MTTTNSITEYWSRTCNAGRRLSHWRSDQPEFDAISRDIGRRLRLQWPDLTKQRDTAWLDWGCGGGAGLLALSEFASVVMGVDVSADDLKICGDEMARLNLPYWNGVGPAVVWFQPIITDGDNPQSAIDQGLWVNDKPLDGFLSTACFQHFPSKAYTERIVRLIPRLVKPGGHVMIQIRRNTPVDYAEYSERSGRPYAERAIYATVWAVDEFSSLLDRHGIQVESIQSLDDLNQYTYFFGHVRPVGENMNHENMS